ncbi:MAG: photosystem II stability/assembly factor-like uncharacterized protein [Saprospiraceae bacterium]|jgi:photosystem II stability/assembly factor-like uncharacterized protein
MKNSCLFILAISFFLFGCNEKANTPIKTDNRIAQKHEPSDEFFLQRAYPDGKFSIKAYTEGLKAAQQSAQNRTVNGFDEEWITQGPGNIGARINTVVANPQNEQIIYAGFSEGGVFKTTDGGANWFPIFDQQTLLSIGDIVLDPNDPEIVYVGTGDVNISGYPFIGDGLYRSNDGGETWTNLGLSEQRIISKIVIDPTETSRIFVACMGLPFERNSERGLYRSLDNGNNWQQVLFLSDSTGVIDVLINPDNPQILYAAGWDRIRNNTESITSGVGARIYKSIDGGDNWTQLEGGLPNAEHSRIGLDMSGTNPSVIFAEYVGTNFQLEAIYKTTDGGNTWLPIPIDEDINGLSGGALGGFGWYFGQVRVNPNDDNDIFLLGVDLWRTLDGGDNWARVGPQWWEYVVHADKHDLVFLPSGNILLATDGGLYRSDMNAENWEDIENIPATQFYRVAYNPHSPNLYYGGAQDNGSTGGNANGINDWDRIYGGDGFQMAFDPFDPDRFFVETQNGNIRMTLDGGVDFFGADDGIDEGDRRNWDMPYIISPHNSAVLYTGTYRLYRGEGNVPDWMPISNSLTDSTSEQHRYHNITSLDESRLIEGLLYVGTGDGNLWRSDNGGTNWVSISDGLPDLYVTAVVASPDFEEVVYVTFSGYRDNEFLPRIYRSDDSGSSWEDISSDLPDLAINDLLLLPEYADSILFVATDGGIYGSLDKGSTWERLGINMPFITVYDLVLNEAKNELVAGTFARSIQSYPLDSLELDDPVITSQQTPEQLVKNTLVITPTLASDYVSIQLGNTEPGRDFEVVILNSKGQLLYHKKGTGERGAFKVAVSNWVAGTYFVKAKMRHGVVSGSFVKI